MIPGRQNTSCFYAATALNDGAQARVLGHLLCQSLACTLADYLHAKIISKLSLTRIEEKSTFLSKAIATFDLGTKEEHTKMAIEIDCAHCCGCRHTLCMCIN